jgi:TolB protein
MRYTQLVALTLLVLAGCSRTTLVEEPQHGWNLLHPAISPDGRQIAFELFNGIWVMPYSGGQATQITSGAQTDDQPRWVPGQGGKLSYRSRRSGSEGLYIHDLNSGSEQKVSGLQDGFWTYDWMPDGRSVVFSRGRKILRLDTETNQTDVVVDSAAGGISHIRCSPDGQRIVYSNGRRVGYQEGLAEMYCVSIDGSRSVNLTGEGVEHYSPVWSPSGDRVAFVSYDAGTEDIYLINFDRDNWKFGEPVRLTSDPAEESSPLWASGDELVIQANPLERSALYRVDTASGNLTHIPVSGLDFSQQTGWLSLTVLDKANGTTIPARVYLQAEDGRAYYPAGTFPRQNIMGDRSFFFHTTGSFTMELPVGEFELDIARGFEYEAQSRLVRISAGETVELRVDLERWIDMAAQGWYSADNHFHANYGGPFRMTPELVMEMLEAEDLNIGNMVAGNSSAGRIYDLEYFNGGMHPLSGDRYQLRWNEEYRSTAYGHMVLMNLKEFVYPQMTGFTLSDYAEDYPPNLDAINAAQAQGGTAHYTHPRSYEDKRRFGDYDAFELPVDLALGSLDAIDLACLWSGELATSQMYYRLLNCGFKMAVSAGTDVFTSRVNPAPGSDRVYAKTGSSLDYQAWIDAFSSGNSFVSTGPMLWFTVDGQPAGSSITLDSASPTVTVEARAQCQIPLDSLEILVNGRAVGVAKPQGNGRDISIKLELPLERSSWIAARALGAGHRLVLDSHLFAHSSPVYVYLGEQKISSAEDAEYFIWWIDVTLKRVLARDRLTDPEHKWRILEIFRLAREYYEKMAGLTE